MMLGDIVVYMVIAVAVLTAIVLLVRAFRKQGGCAGCSDCPLAANCSKPARKQD